MRIAPDIAWGVAPLFFLAQAPVAAAEPLEDQGSGAPAKPAATPPPSRNDDIVVTARRREESIQDVPLSVQAFSPAALQERQIDRLSDLTQVVPGLTAQASPFGNAALTLAVRGQRQGLANIAYDPAVSVYADEVVQARTQGLNDAFFDLSSVQVLKGPQGTLFGRNTTGGAILLTSQAPTDGFGGYVDATVGNYDLFRAEGALNVPMADGVALRLSGVRTRRDGYLRNYAANRRIDNQRSESWRASLRIAPTGSGFENRLIVSGFHENDDGVAYKLVDRNPAIVLANGTAADQAFYATAPFFTSNTDARAHGTRIKTLNVSNISTIDLGGITVKNIFGYRHVNSSIFFDLDGTSFLLANSEQKTRVSQYSNETQLLGTLADKQFDYVLGAYLFRERGDEVQTVEILNPAADNNLITDYSILSETAAIYGQSTYRPAFLPGLSMTGGLRYTWDGKRIDSRSRTYNGVCRLLTADVGGVPRDPCLYSASANFSKLTYAGTVDYRITPAVMGYFTHRYGYQGGGFTNSATRPGDFQPYRPQTVNDFELGLKSSFSLGALDARFNVAAFQGKFKDVQRLLRLTFVSGGIAFPLNRIINAATSTVKGIELDGQISYEKLVKLSFAYTFLDAGYDNYVVNNNGVIQDYTNAGIAGAPRHSVSGALRVKLPLPDSLAQSYVQVDGSYQTRTYAEDTTNFDPVTQTIISRSILPGYGTINARLDFEQIGERGIDLSLWVKNLTKEEYYTAGFDSYTSTGNVVRLLGTPRTFGASLRYEF